MASLGKRDASLVAAARAVVAANNAQRAPAPWPYVLTLEVLCGVDGEHVRAVHIQDAD